MPWNPLFGHFPGRICKEYIYITIFYWIQTKYHSSNWNQYFCLRISTSDLIDIGLYHTGLNYSSINSYCGHKWVNFTVSVKMQIGLYSDHFFSPFNSFWVYMTKQYIVILILSNLDCSNDLKGHRISK